MTEYDDYGYPIVACGEIFPICYRSLHGLSNTILERIWPTTLSRLYLGMTDLRFLARLLCRNYCTQDIQLPLLRVPSLLCQTCVPSILGEQTLFQPHLLTQPGFRHHTLTTHSLKRTLMDFHLRCNSLKCRSKLDVKAVVTTCSHIFCVPCAESLGLASANASARTCPACQTQLSNDDDVVVTELNPTEDYKTSVLSGLSPAIIIECAGRGMAFYHYQTTQEMYAED